MFLCLSVHLTEMLVLKEGVVNAECSLVKPGPYFKMQAEQTLSLILISDLIDPELRHSEFSVSDQLIRINSEAVQPEGSAFTVSCHQWSADHMIHNDGL